jgi:PKD repeat protein
VSYCAWLRGYAGSDEEVRGPAMSHVRASVRAALFLLLPVAAGLLLPLPALAAPNASFNFAPQAPFTSEPVTFTSTSSGGTETWDLDDDGNCDDAAGPSVQRSFPVAGIYRVKLCVSDGILEATATGQVQVVNRAPLASFTYAPLAPQTGDRIVLTSTAVDPDGPIVAQVWDLDGDGAFDDAGGETAAVSFTKPAVYAVRLLVVDRDGATGLAAATIAVKERPLELLASFPIIRLSGRVSPRGTRIRALTVDAPRGTGVKVSCRGRGCPFRSITKAAADASRLMTVRRLKGRLLRPRAVLRIWVTSVDRIGKYTRFRIRRGKPPDRADRCTRPGVRLPVRCPAGTS